MNEILVKELQEELEKLRSEKQELKKEIKELKMKTSSVINHLFRLKEQMC